MRVKAFIELLKTMPQDARVVVWTREDFPDEGYLPAMPTNLNIKDVDGQQQGVVVIRSMTLEEIRHRVEAAYEGMKEHG